MTTRKNPLVNWDHEIALVKRGLVNWAPGRQAEMRGRKKRPVKRLVKTTRKNHS